IGDDFGRSWKAKGPRWHRASTEGQRAGQGAGGACILLHQESSDAAGTACATLAEHVASEIGRLAVVERCEVISGRTAEASRRNRRAPASGGSPGAHGVGEV